MKIFLTDEKHNTVEEQTLDLGTISDAEEVLIEKVLGFINEKSSRYTQFRIGNKAYTVYDDGEAVSIEVE